MTHWQVCLVALDLHSSLLFTLSRALDCMLAFLACMHVKRAPVCLSPRKPVYLSRSSLLGPQKPCSVNNPRVESSTPPAESERNVWDGN